MDKMVRYYPKALKFFYMTYKPYHEKICLLHSCEKKGADKLRGNCAAHQCLCFRYIDSIGRFQAIKTDVLLIFLFIIGDKTEFLWPMMF